MPSSPGFAARDVRISSQGESASLQVDALTVRGAGASSPNVTGRLSFAAGADVEMTGKLAFDNATDANSVGCRQGRTFFADAAGAGIAVTNGTALAGSVDVDARSIVVASRSAVTDLGSTANIDARSNRLGLNDGTTDNAGFIRAGGIRLSASEKITSRIAAPTATSPTTGRVSRRARPASRSSPTASPRPSRSSSTGVRPIRRAASSRAKHS
jgi:hypothetical protein